jgi:hypothetical protein
MGNLNAISLASHYYVWHDYHLHPYKLREEKSPCLIHLPTHLPTYLQISSR